MPAAVAVCVTLSKPSNRLAAVVLAAGNSVRLGQPKQQVKLHGTALLRRAAQLALPVAGQVIVVLGTQHREQQKLIHDLPVDVVVNQNPSAGLGASIACGVQQLNGKPDGVLLLLVDQYRLNANHIESLAGRWHSEPEQITAAGFAGTHGPPVIFPSRYFARLSELQGNGAKPLLTGQALTSVPIPEAEINLNTPQDLIDLRRFEQTAN